MSSSHKKTGSRGKTHRTAGEPVFGVNNPAVFLRKILGLFSMAKRQNFSRQPYAFSHSACFLCASSVICKKYILLICISNGGKAEKKLWDAGKMKKRAPGLRDYSGAARMRRDGTLGDCFFSFAVAGTRNFHTLLPQIHATARQQPYDISHGSPFFFCEDLDLYDDFTNI